MNDRIETVIKWIRENPLPFGFIVGSVIGTAVMFL